MNHNVLATHKATGRNIVAKRYGSWPVILIYLKQVAQVFLPQGLCAGAMNRVASAVGEGSMAISFVHKYLAEI
jgi:hypothetical protein